MKEIWKHYDGDYLISNRGNVKNKYLQDLKPRLNSTGYLRVNILGREVFVHRMVAECFLPKSKKYYINHKGLNKKNNNVDNLEYCTQSENLIHYYRIKRERLYG